MGSHSWIARVVRLAESLRPDHWREGRAARSAGPWRQRRDLQPDGLSVRRLEERRVLNAQIQSLVLPTAAVEGDTVQVSAEATGFGSLSFDWTITHDSTVIARGFTQDFSFETPDDGDYDVSLVVTDSADQVFDVETGEFTVANAEPSILDPASTAINEHGVTTLTGVIQDPGASDTFELHVDWGDPSSPGDMQVIDLSGPLPPGVTFDPETRAFSVEHQYLDDNPTNTPSDSYEIKLTVYDDSEAMGQAETSVLVSNVAPTIDDLAATPHLEYQGTILSGTINDPGTLDTFKLEIDWGDPSSPGNTQVVDFSVVEPGVFYNPATRQFAVLHEYQDDNPNGTPSDTHTISVKVVDDDTGYSTAETTVAVGNVAPMLSDVTATDVDEAGATTLAGKIVDPGTKDDFTLTVLWGDGSQDTYNYAAGTTEFSEAHTYADDNPTGTPSDLVTIKLTLIDDDTGSDEHEVDITVANVAPTLMGLAATGINENQRTVLTGKIVDPGTEDTHTLEINWGDPLSPDNVQTIDLTVQAPGVTYYEETGEFAIEHQYLDDNPTATASDSYSISVKVTDDDTGSDQGQTTVEVSNVAPQFSLLAFNGSSIDENGEVFLIGTINDPGSLDTHQLKINWGDPLSPDNVQTIDLDAGHPDLLQYTGGLFIVRHQYLDDNPSATAQDTYTVAVELLDDDGGSVEASLPLQLKNVAPTIAQLETVDINEDGVTTLSGKIIDPGTLDTFKLEINWGDSFSPGNVQTIDLTNPPSGVTFNAETREFTVTHQYLDDNPTATAADTYVVSVKVTDDDGGVGHPQRFVEVTNVAPTVTELDAVDINEDGVTTLTGSYTDPGTLDTHQVVVDWDDANDATDSTFAIDPIPTLTVGDTFNSSTDAAVLTIIAIVGDTVSFSVQHQYLDDGAAPGNGTLGDISTIKVTVTDDDTGVGMEETDVTVTNVAPTFSEVTAGDIAENGITTLSGKIVDPGTLDTFTLTVNWSDGTVQDYTTTPGASGIDLLNPPAGVTYDPVTRVFTIEHQYLDDNPTATTSDPYEIRLTLVDDDTDMAVDATTITVSNVAPEIFDLSADDINENGATTLTGSYTDPGTLDTQTVVVEWDDPNSSDDSTFAVDALFDLTIGDTFNSSTDDAVLTITGLTADTVSFSVQHQYLDDGPAPGNGTGSDISTIRVTVTDDDTGEGSAETTVEVTNVAPVIDEIADATIDEGDKVAIYDGVVDDHTAAATVVGTFTDFGTLDTHTAEVDWGDGTVAEVLSIDQMAGGGGLFGSHTFADNGVYTVTVTVTDDDGGADEAAFTVTVLNVDPELTGTDGHEVFEGDPVTLAGLGVGITDPGFDNPLNILDPGNGGEVEETFTGVMIDWGDGSPTTDVVNVVDRVSGSPGVPTTASFSHDAHYYADDGTYTVSVTLRDDDGSDVTHAFEILVKNVDPTLVLTDEMFVINEGEVLMLPGLGMFTDPGAENALNPNGASDETFHYSIDWGDGNTDDLQLPVSLIDNGAGVGKSGEIANQHFYADNDPDSVYTITVTLYDDDGGMDQKQFDIVVNNVNPSWVPLTESELIDDDWMPDLFADAKDLEGDGITVFVVHFTDPGADTYEVWIDWGDKLDQPDGDPRFVQATPINTVITEKGVALYFTYAYAGPPNPADPAADIEVTALVVDDDYLASTGGQLVFDAETSFLFEPGRSAPVSALATNPGLDAGGVAIDTTPEIALIEFPPLEDFIVPPDQQADVGGGLQTQDAPSGGGDVAAVTERVWELRAVTPDGKVSQPFRLKPDVMDDLPGLFVRLPDGRYLIFLLRTENNTRRLALDVYIRNGKPIDISDDSDGARDKPPTTEEGDLDPGAEQIEIQLEALDPAQQEAAAAPIQTAPIESVPLEPDFAPSDQRHLGGLLATAGVAAVLSRPSECRAYRDEVEEALEQSNPQSWKLLAALRRRPR